MIKYGVLSALLGALAGGGVFVVYCIPTYGISAFALGLVLVFVAIIAGTILAIPLMKLKKYIPEPYYFFMFMLVGFIGGIFAVNITFGRNPFEPVAWASWLVFTYGPLGAVCSLTSWWHLKRNENKWYVPT